MVASGSIPAPPPHQALPPTNDRPRPLFGGALQMIVPPSFADVSQIRQLPDNQEVFADATTDTSLILEIVETSREANSDRRSPAAWHWDALADDSSAILRELHWAGTVNTSPRTPRLHGSGALSLAAGLQRVAKFRDADAHASDVRVHLACIALPRADAHLLLSMAAPQRLHPAGSSARAGATAGVRAEDSERDAALPFYRALLSLEVRDWALFGAS